jgi:hypothetical protein
MKKGFQSDDASNNRVAGFIDTAGGAYAKWFDNFVSILWSVHKLFVTRNVRPNCYGGEWTKSWCSVTPQKSQFRRTLVPVQQTLKWASTIG